MTTGADRSGARALDAIVCADWSGRPGHGREVYAALPSKRLVRRIAPPIDGWTVDAVLSSARALGESVLVGFDAPIGLPRSLAARLGLSGGTTFATWLDSMDTASTFFDPVTSAEHWCPHRPFYRVPRGQGARRRFDQAAARFGVELMRQIDRASGGLPPFLIGLPGAVGLATIDLWRGLIEARRRPASPLLWPFECPVAAPPVGVIVAEIYPKLAYTLALGRRVVPKGQQAARELALDELEAAEWLRGHAAHVEAREEAARSEDAFDALFTAVALLRVVLEGRLFSNGADQVEGGILGSSAQVVAKPARTRSGPGSASRRISSADEGARMPTKDMATSVREADERDLWNAPEDGRKYELVDGELIVSPAGGRHGQICVRFVLAVGNFVRDRGLGEVFDSSTGFRLPSGNVRLPDVSFVSAAQLPGGVTSDFNDVPPSLAIEVLSPSDRPRLVLDKVGEYLQAGVPLVWVVDPDRQRAAVYRSSTDVRHIGIDGSLDGEDVLPGFAVSLRTVLA